MGRISVAFIEGRPKGHPTHRKYAEAINSDFFHVDEFIRYHDLPTTSSIRRYCSWIVNALFFKKNYDVFFSEEAYFMVGLLKWLRLIRRRQKIVALMSTHTLYFLKKGRYSPFTTRATITLLNKYDGFICVGEFQRQLLLEFLGKNTSIPIITTFNGVEKSRLAKLSRIEPDLNSHNIVFIGDVGNQNRIWYKGLDLMLEAFNLVKLSFPDTKFFVVGHFVEEEVAIHMQKVDPLYQDTVVFTGRVTNIDEYLQNSGLYLHCSRGEAWGISITEAMASGVVPIISEDTGAREVVKQVDDRLIVPQNVTEIARAVQWYFNLPISEKRHLSEVGRRLVAEHYTEEKAVSFFKNQFSSLISKLQSVD